MNNLTQLPVLAPQSAARTGHAASAAQRRRRDAAVAAALLDAALALSRWRSGHTLGQMQAAAAMLPGPQAHWHAAVQRQLGAWLQAGGFAAERARELAADQAAERAANEAASQAAEMAAVASAAARARAAEHVTRAAADAQLKTAALRRCSQPHCGTLDEESKFSLLRIHDAVE